MTTLHADFETRSTVDLKKQGVFKYAGHPNTDVWCLAYAFDEEDVGLWLPGMKPPARIVSHLILQDGPIIGHNVGFEWAIWNAILTKRYGFPALPIEQCYCTAAMAAAMALPRDLAGAAIATGLEVGKDMEGRRLMMQMAKPRKVKDDGSIIWWDDKARLDRLTEYCKQDVITERALEKRLVPLRSRERDLWLLDHKINSRGVKVDLPTVENAIELIGIVQEQLNEQIKQVTDGAVAKVTEAFNLAQWCTSRGVKMDSVDKEHVAAALYRKDLPDDVRGALLLRQEGAKSSTAKLNAMIAAASSDGRARDMFMFHGASTGRWSGMRIQLQNMPRPSRKFKEIEEIIDTVSADEEAVRVIQLLHGPVPTVISDCLRSLLIAEDGKDLMSADFSNIEGRVLAWLAEEHWKVKAFREFDAGTGEDLYKLAYARSFNVAIRKINDEQRQVGKVMELALGYGGGVGAFQNMAANYGVVVEDERADALKVAWREAHPNIKQFWYDLEGAAMAAIKSPGSVQVVGRIRFRVAGSFLWCQLPSGRCLSYAYPKIKKKQMPWIDDRTGEPAVKDTVFFMGVDSVTRKWGVNDTYGGKLAENVTQAVARDLLAEAMLRVDPLGYTVVMHVHDEIVTEVPEGFGDLKEFEALMSELPPWAVGCPVAAAGWRGKRYRK